MLKTLINIDAKQLDHLSDSFGLPLHIISLEQLAHNAKLFLQVAKRLYPKMLVAFAVKSNPCRGALRAVRKLDIGADVGSEYELQAAIEEGIPPEKIVCNGNAKSSSYIEIAIGSSTLIAADNPDEISLLNETGSRMGLKARTLVRLSGMPLEGLTSANQSTASAWTKFGISLEEVSSAFRLLKSCPYIEFEGLSAHIGTQICDPGGYEKLVDHLFDVAMIAGNFGFKVQCFNIGGGFPVAFMSLDEWEHFTSRLRDQLAGRIPTEEWVTWDNLPMGYSYLQGRVPVKTDKWIGKAYWSKYPGATMLEKLLKLKVGTQRSVSERLAMMGSPSLIIEPGRAMIGPAGVTVARALGVKKVLGNLVIILDLGINNHGTNLLSSDIFPVEVVPKKASDEPTEAFLAGRLCFNGDMISVAKVRLNRLPERGELVLIHFTGAYGADHFASNSCGFPRPAKIAIREDGAIEVWRRPEKFSDVFVDPA